MAEGLRKPAQLSFMGNVAENWRIFKQDFEIYVQAAHSEKTDKVKAYILLNLAGPEAIEREKTFTYANGKSKEDLAELKKKFEELCLPRQNIIVERHTFNTRRQRDGESFESFVSDLRVKALLKLQQYNIELLYKKGQDLKVADTLSRAHGDDDANEDLDEYEVLSLLPITKSRYEKLKHETANDKTLSYVMRMVRNGWPQKLRDIRKDARSFFTYRDELMVDEELLFKGQRIIIPYTLREDYLEQLHKGHPGVQATMRRAHETVYWPNMDQNIQDAVQTCSPCNAHKPAQQKEPMLMNQIPTLPWQFVAIDIFEWKAQQYLVTVDSYSGWFEVNFLGDTRSSTIISKLKRHFAAYGIPATIYSDSAAQFLGSEFQKFCLEWDINHKTSSPHYHQSNGLAERAVQSAKMLMKKCEDDGTDFYLALLNLRNVPRQGMGSHAECFLSRKTRTLLTLTENMLKPKVQQNTPEALYKRRYVNKQQYDKHASSLSELKPGKTVRMKTDKGFQRKAVVVECKPNRSYVVKSGNRFYTRNRRHLLECNEKYDGNMDIEAYENFMNVASSRVPYSQPSVLSEKSVVQAPKSILVKTQSGRTIKPPVRFNDFVSY